MQSVKIKKTLHNEEMLYVRLIERETMGGIISLCKKVVKRVVKFENQQKGGSTTGNNVPPYLIETLFLLIKRETLFCLI